MVYLCSYGSEAKHASSVSHHLLSSIPPFPLSLLSNYYHLGYSCPTASSQECVCVCVCVYIFRFLHCFPLYIGNLNLYLMG